MGWSEVHIDVGKRRGQGGFPVTGCWVLVAVGEGDLPHFTTCCTHFTCLDINLLEAFNQHHLPSQERPATEWPRVSLRPRQPLHCN
jgi:hypothetical protein